MEAQRLKRWLITLVKKGRLWHTRNTAQRPGQQQARGAHVAGSVPLKGYNEVFAHH